MKLGDLETFVVRAKSATYVGGGLRAESSRLGSHDLTFESAEWLYRDSYFGGTDFLGQETVWFQEEPVWAENYYGYILRPDLIDAESRKDDQGCPVGDVSGRALPGRL